MKRALAAIFALALTACTSEQLIDLTGPPKIPPETPLDGGVIDEPPCDQPAKDAHVLTGGVHLSISNARPHAPHLVPLGGTEVAVFTVEEQIPSNFIVSPSGRSGGTFFDALRPAEDWALASRLVTFVDDRKTIAFPTDRGVGTFAAPPGTIFGEPSTLNDGFVIVSFGPSDPIRAHVFTAAAVGFIETPQTIAIWDARHEDEVVDARVFSEHWLSYADGERVHAMSFDALSGSIGESHLLHAGCFIDQLVVRVLERVVFAAVRCDGTVELVDQSLEHEHETNTHLLACNARPISPALAVNAAQELAIVAFWRQGAGWVDLRFSNGGEVVLSGVVDRPVDAHGVDVVFNNERWVASFIEGETGSVYFQDN